jgi:hypothetical protein
VDAKTIEKFYNMFQAAIATTLEAASNAGGGSGVGASEMTGAEGEVNYIEYEQFERQLFVLVFPEWIGIAHLSDRVFQAFDRHNRGRLDVLDFIAGVEKIRKASLQQQFQCKYNISIWANCSLIVYCLV